jgi:predicted DNA-binding protein (UPF0251 family)
MNVKYKKRLKMQKEINNMIAEHQALAKASGLLLTLDYYAKHMGISRVSISNMVNNKNVVFYTALLLRQRVMKRLNKAIVEGKIIL